MKRIPNRYTEADLLTALEFDCQLETAQTHIKKAYKRVAKLQ